MTGLTLLCLAVGLAADALAVSIAYGLGSPRIDHRTATKLAGSFGAFQAGMPLLGWLCGDGLSGSIEAFDHWVAAGLLWTIGGKMILGVCRRTDYKKSRPLGTDFRTILLLAVATSLDALAVGLSLSLLQVEPFQAALTIGVVTLILCFLGTLAGQKLGGQLGEKSSRAVQAMGGALLLLVGIRVLVSHLIPAHSAPTAPSSAWSATGSL